MNRLQKLKMGLVVIIVMPSLSLANIGSDLAQFYKDIGGAENSTSAQAYQGQSAGYYTGGGLFMRGRVRNFQLGSIQLPSHSEGCSGIDLWTGGFSFINKSQLRQAYKSIANNSVNYAFKLGIKTISPMIESTMSELQKIANKINAQNINSCETAASLVGSVWPKTEVAQKEVCESIGASHGLFEDFAAARQGCGAAGQQSSTLSKIKKDGNYQDIVLQNTNIAWRAIQKNAFLRDNQALAELFMSLSGTIIVTHDGGDEKKNHFKVLSTLSLDNKLLRALLTGSSAESYHCDEHEKCLNVTKSSIQIAKKDTLNTKVRETLGRILNKIYDDAALSDSEKSFLNATHIPVHKFLEVQAAYFGTQDLVDVDELSQMISVSMLFQYIEESLSVVKNSAGTLQYPQDIMRQFMKSIDDARVAVQAKKQESAQKVKAKMLLLERYHFLEKQLAGKLSDELSANLKWSTGMRN